jgi:hypothetical protein
MEDGSSFFTNRKITLRQADSSSKSRSRRASNRSVTTGRDAGCGVRTAQRAVPTFPSPPSLTHDPRKKSCLTLSWLEVVIHSDESMSHKRKTWQEKLADSKDFPKVCRIDSTKSKRWGTGTFVIPARKKLMSL